MLYEIKVHIPQVKMWLNCELKITNCTANAGNTAENINIESNLVIHSYARSTLKSFKLKIVVTDSTPTKHWVIFTVNSWHTEAKSTNVTRRLFDCYSIVIWCIRSYSFKPPNHCSSDREKMPLLFALSVQFDNFLDHFNHFCL